MEEKCVYCGGDLPEKPTKVKVRTRSFEVCCADCAAKTEQYIKPVSYTHLREFHERKMNYESCCENGDRF